MKPRLKQAYGIIKRADFAEYIAAISKHVGFHFESPDFTGVRHTGRGLHIKRRKRRHIGLELELQARWAIAFTCPRDVIDGVVYSTLTLVQNYENGVITETQTAAGGVHLHTPSDETYACPEIEVSSDYDDEFDYGGFIDAEDPAYSGELDPALLLPAAAAGLENDGAPAVAQSWSWLDTEAPPTGITQNLGSWSGSPDALTARRIDSRRYRWRVTGPHALDLSWDQGGSTLSTTVAAGSTSGWYDDAIPATEGVPDVLDNVIIDIA